jgi:separase
MQAEESALLAKLSLENVYTRFQADMFLNSLSESSEYPPDVQNSYTHGPAAITLPMGVTKNEASSLSSGQEVIGVLNNAERLFWSDLTLISRRGNVFDVRDAAISLALIRAFQTSLGNSTNDSPVLAARLLGQWTVRC